MLIDSLGAGGAEKQLVDLSAWLVGQGVEIFTVSQGGHYAAQAQNHRGVAGGHLFPLATWRALNLIPRPDLVHAHSIRAFCIARTWCWFHKVPLVFTIHGWSSRKLSLGRFLLVTLKPKMVYCVSTDLFDRFVRVLPATKRIPNGVGDRMPEQSTNRNRRGAEVRLLTVGRLASPKNQSEAVRAVRYLRDRGIGASLDILGNGPDDASLRQLVSELKLDEVVKFWGFRDPLPFLQKAQVYISSSLSEGLSLAHIEALMAGLPIVVTPTSGARDVTAFGNGVVSKGFDGGALGEAIRQLLTMDLQLLGHQSRRLYECHFTLEAMGNRYLESYRGIVG